MSKYTLSITDNETGKVDTIACEGFAILADYDGTHGTTLLQDINLLTLSAIMSGSKEIRDAAKLAEMIMRLDSANPLSTVIEEIRDGE